MSRRPKDEDDHPLSVLLAVSFGVFVLVLLVLFLIVPMARPAHATTTLAVEGPPEWMP